MVYTEGGGVKMTPVISRLTIIETKNYRIEVQGIFAFRKHAEIYT